VGRSERMLEFMKVKAISLFNFERVPKCQIRDEAGNGLAVEGLIRKLCRSDDDFV